MRPPIENGLRCIIDWAEHTQNVLQIFEFGDDIWNELYSEIRYFQRKWKLNFTPQDLMRESPFTEVIDHLYRELLQVDQLARIAIVKRLKKNFDFVNKKEYLILKTNILSLADIHPNCVALGFFLFNRTGQFIRFIDECTNEFNISIDEISMPFYEKINNQYLEDKLNMIDTHINMISFIVDTILRYPIIGIDDVTLKTIYEEPIIATNKTYTAFQNEVNNAKDNKLQIILRDLQAKQHSLKEFYEKNPDKVQFAEKLYFNPYKMTDALIDRAISGLPIPDKIVAMLSTHPSDISQFIVKDREKVLHFIDSELSACSKPQGKLVAMIIIVLYKAGYIVEINGKLKAIHNALKDKYPNKVGNLQGIVDYVNSCCKEGYSGDKNITDGELESLRKKLE